MPNFHLNFLRRVLNNLMKSVTDETSIFAYKKVDLPMPNFHLSSSGES